MRRSEFLRGADGPACPDELIPRCMDAADAPHAVFNNPDSNRLAAFAWPKAFSDRVMDAKRRLQAGAHPDSVREIHGAIVVRQAVAELLPKAKMLA